MSELSGAAPKDPVETAVQSFLDANPYPGFSRPFQLEGLTRDEVAAQVRKYDNTFVARLRGVEDEDIAEIDREWLRGLHTVGQQFGIKIRLPSQYFEK